MKLVRSVTVPMRRTWLIVPLVAAGFALLTSLVIAPRVMRSFGESKRDIARAMVDRYANEAYPAWREAHPSQDCPVSLVELNEYFDWRSTKDPWGDRYEMICAHHGFVVYSLGEDRRLGTTDDIWSHR